jgi:alanyl-tRNA synthetase
MKSNDVRASFLDFFVERGHRVVPSSPLIPYDDPTLLFTNAGMNQFKNVFLGLEKRDYQTAASSQKCLRAGGKHNDLENVGFTARHQTFFEMLGNFSFGDYFKEDAIVYAWEWVTKTLGLDPRHLYATVYREDDDADRLWKKIAPELGDRVLRFGEHDNFWSMGETGPCGPCSEIHYDRGPKYPGELNGEGDRFTEIWNLVFMQYNRDENKVLTPLPKPSVDTGAGLERFCMVIQNAESNYDTDLFMPLLEKVANITGKEYRKDASGVSHRVISDHVRALSFAIADGGIISNEGRGYVLRRILRRAARHGRLLGTHEPFLYNVVEPLVKVMGGHYHELVAKGSHIELVIRSEEEQFGRTLDTGLEIFEDIVKKVESSGARLIPGSEVFRLYDTYGFPVDLTEVMAKERGLHVDMAGYEEEIKKQRERSKAASKFGFEYIEDSESIRSQTDKKSEFVGYDKTVIDTIILGPLEAPTDRLYLEETPFYAEAGGQVGDTGVIENTNLRFIVEDTKRFGDDINHFGHFEFISPSLNNIIVEEKVVARVDAPRRADIKRNHTATHLLHKALRMVQGEHVHQAGSLVAPDRLRFDFTHFKAMTAEEIDKVERIVIDKIHEDLPVNWDYKSLDEARQMGAMALFGERYGDTVRVVTTGKSPDIFSMELCGGTHVTHTGDIGEFFVTQETAIAAGMRRIEALTGTGAAKFLTEQNEIVSRIREYLKKDLDSLTEDDISKFRALIGNVHKRLLRKLSLNTEVDRLLKSADEMTRKRSKDTRKKKNTELSNQAMATKPKLTESMAGGINLRLYVENISDNDDLITYTDYLKREYKNDILIAVSGSTCSANIITNEEIRRMANIDSQLLLDAYRHIDASIKGGGRPEFTRVKFPDDYTERKIIDSTSQAIAYINQGNFPIKKKKK